MVVRLKLPDMAYKFENATVRFEMKADKNGVKMVVTITDDIYSEEEACGDSSFVLHSPPPPA